MATEELLGTVLPLKSRENSVGFVLAVSEYLVHFSGNYKFFISGDDSWDGDVYFLNLGPISPSVPVRPLEMQFGHLSRPRGGINMDIWMNPLLNSPQEIQARGDRLQQAMGDFSPSLKGQVIDLEKIHFPPPGHEGEILLTSQKSWLIR